MVERRLALAYGERAGLAFASEEGRTRVTLTLPREGPAPGVLT
jgi:two-component system, LytTR family, sensor histidine kinase AlgZ